MIYYYTLNLVFPQSSYIPKLFNLYFVISIQSILMILPYKARAQAPAPVKTLTHRHRK